MCVRLSTSITQPQLFIPNEDHPQTLDFNSRFKEQESISSIKKCHNIEEFKQIHGQILKLGFFYSPFVSSNLLSTCALSDWRSMDYACSIFKQIENPGSFEFNTMIRGHVEDMNLEQCLVVYNSMLENGVQPDNFTYPFLLKGCAYFQAIDEGMQIHGHLFKLGLESDLFVQNGLINLYGKCGKTNRSCAVFEKMEKRSIASWSALISGYAKQGMWSQCLSLFFDMIQFWRPEESILVSVVSACAHLDALDLGKCSHGYLLKNMSGLNVIVETTLIDMYVKCGSLEKGLSLFRRTAKKNELTYSVMIKGLAMNGCSREALNIFMEMLEKGLEPDEVVYVSVLSACSNGGFVEEGLKFFDMMRFEHRIDPTVQHYGCMVDLMARAGLIDKAMEIIEAMPMEPNGVIWRSLLHSCRVHQNVKIGEIAAENLLKMSSDNVGDYLTVSNMYANANRWEDVAKVRTKIASFGLTQIPGFSLVEVKKRTHKFVSQDMSFPEVYEMLHQMGWQLKFEGYLPDTSEVLNDVDEEEKRQRLNGHSQKLALAFALIHTEEGSPVKIMRNVRMCGDCHNYTKLVSIVYGRKITVRDRNRFHHFKDGTCSCKDYW